MTLTEARERVGQQVMSNHHWAYRYGEWATIVAATVGITEDRIVWAVIWPDGDTDVWAADDPTANYQFRSSADEPKLMRTLEALENITLAIKADVETPGIRAPRELRNELIGILSKWKDDVRNA